MLSVQPNERALLTSLVGRLQALDADVLVGHNIAAFDLSVLLHRMQHHKVSKQADSLVRGQRAAARAVGPRSLAGFVCYTRSSMKSCNSGT